MKQVFSLRVWECVNHPPVFMHVLIIVVDLQKFHQIPTKSQGSVHCCAVPSKRQKSKSKLDSVHWENWRSMGEQSQKHIKAVVDGINKFFLSTLPFRWLDWII